MALVTVHGRTRCQFYGGKADWAAIARVREAISIPLIANGDGTSVADAREMLAKSGADGVMIGRGAYGRPWWPGVIAEGLDPGSGARGADARRGGAASSPSITSAFSPTMAHHHGNRIARKHIGWAIGRLAERNLLARRTGRRLARRPAAHQ